MDLMDKDIILLEISKRISEWKKLARILGLSENQIDIIDHNYITCEEKCFQSIQCYQQETQQIDSWEAWKEKLKLIEEEGRLAIQEIEDISHHKSPVESDDVDYSRIHEDADFYIKMIEGKISNSKGFAEALELPDFNIRQVEKDYDESEKKNVKYIKIYEGLHGKQNDITFWQDTLFCFDDGKLVLEEIEIDKPQYISKSLASHKYMKNSITKVCHHYDLIDNQLTDLPFNKEKLIHVNVGAGTIKYFNYENYADWVTTRHNYLKTYLVFKDIYIMDFTNNSDEQCPILHSVQLCLKANHDTGFALKGYSLRNHYNLFGGQVLREDKFDDMIFIYSVNLNMVIYLIYCEDLSNIGELLHGMSKQIQLACSLHDSLNCHSVVHVGVIVYNDYNDVDKNMLCGKCLEKGLLVSRTYFINSFRKWYDQMINNNEIYRNVPHEVSDSAITDTLEICNKIRDSIITYMALHRYNFPTFTNVPSEQMDELVKLVLLTPDQFKILYSPYKHILIKGGYGSGKSLVFQKKFEHVVRKSTENDIFYFLCQDHQSRFALQMKYIKSLHPSKHILVCNSRDVVGMSVQLSSLLEHFRRVWKNHIVHLFTDEFYAGSLNIDEINKLQNLIKYFCKSYIVIGMQSMEHDEIVQEPSSNIKTSKCFLYDVLTKDMQFQSFLLNYSLRCSVEINNFVKETVEILESTHLHTKRESTIDKVYSDYNAIMDREHGMDNYATRRIDEGFNVVNKYRYNHPQTIGHSVSCEKVQIYSVLQNQFHEMYNVYLILSNVIDSITTHPDRLLEEKRIVLCVFTASIYDSLYKMLKHLDITWTNDIGEFNKQDFQILLIDYASIRGYEYENVICVLPISHQYLKYRLVECFTRATKHLYLLAIENNEYDGEELFLNKWKQSEYVDFHEVVVEEENFYIVQKNERQLLEQHHPLFKENSFYEELDSHYPWGEVILTTPQMGDSHIIYDLERAIDLVIMYDDVKLFEDLIFEHQIDMTEKKTVLHRATERNAQKVLSSVINTFEIHVDTLDYLNRTALHIAVTSNNHDVVKYLLNFGPDMTIEDGEKKKPMDYAAENSEMEKLLMEYIEKDVKARNITSSEPVYENRIKKMSSKITSEPVRDDQIKKESTNITSSESVNENQIEKMSSKITFEHPSEDQMKKESTNITSSESVDENQIEKMSSKITFEHLSEDQMKKESTNITSSEPVNENQIEKMSSKITFEHLSDDQIKKEYDAIASAECLDGITVEKKAAVIGIDDSMEKFQRENVVTTETGDNISNTLEDSRKKYPLQETEENIKTVKDVMKLESEANTEKILLTKDEESNDNDSVEIYNLATQVKEVENVSSTVTGDDCELNVKHDESMSNKTYLETCKESEIIKDNNILEGTSLSDTNETELKGEKVVENNHVTSQDRPEDFQAKEITSVVDCPSEDSVQNKKTLSDNIEIAIRSTQEYGYSEMSQRGIEESGSCKVETIGSTSFQSEYKGVETFKYTDNAVQESPQQVNNNGKKPLTKELVNSNSDTENFSQQSRKKPFPSNKFIFITSLIILFISVSIINSYDDEEISHYHLFHTVEQFLQKIDQVFDKYPEQPLETKKMIRNVGRDHLIKIADNDDLIRPVCFLVAGYKGSEQTMDCFTKDIATAFTNQSYKIIKSDPLYKKELLDENIKHGLENSQKFLVIKDINVLPFKTAQIFMSYCDSYNDASKYPKSVLILTTILPFEFDTETFSRKSDELRVANHFVEELWKDGGNINVIAPLWSRVGDGLVLVRRSEMKCISKGRETEL